MDQFPDEPDGYPAHDALFVADCRIVENLTNLAALPPEFELLTLPLSIPGSDASPVRAVARTDGDNSNCIPA